MHERADDRVGRRLGRRAERPVEQRVERAAGTAPVNLLDLLLLGGIAMAAYGGWRLGLLARGLSWIGLLVGLGAAVWLLPKVLGRMREAGDGWILVAGLALLVAGAFAGQAAGMLAGGRLRPRLPSWADPLERAGGAVLGVVGAVVFVWLALPALDASRDWPRDQYRDSLVVSVLDGALPEPPSAARSFREIVESNPLPGFFDGTGVDRETSPAPTTNPLDAATTARVEQSILRVEARACGRIQDGSGFVTDGGLIVTNAHVVAGGGEVAVFEDSGARHGATVVAFDPVRDLAVIRAEGLDVPAVPIGVAGSDDVGAVFGFPGGEALRVEPYRVAEVVRASGRDLYDTRDTRRRVLFVVTDLSAGDSGAALVNTDGLAVGVAFAVDPDDRQVAYALHSDELRAVLAGVDAAAVSTSDCLD